MIVCINVPLKHLFKSKSILVTSTDRRNNFSQGRSFYKYLEDGLTGFFHIPLRHEQSTKGSDSLYHINILQEELTPPVRFKYILFHHKADQSNFCLPYFLCSRPCYFPVRFHSQCGFFMCTKTDNIVSFIIVMILRCSVSDPVIVNG